jgi:hypothetical protein
MRRREFITILGGAAAAWPLAARAQQVSSVPRIGYLSPGSASPGPLNYYDEFRRELRELGYVEGQNIVIDYRFANGKFDRLPQLAAELVQLNVDVIVSVVTQASLAAKNATRTIPIVIVSVGDPVGAGLVASLARPGANVTGNSSMTIEVIGKSLALLKQAVPTGVDMVHIQYRGSGPALIDLLAGQVQVGFDTMPGLIEYIRAGRLRALAVCTATRSHALPDVPTVSEFVPGYESSGYFGFGAPARTPAGIIDKLNNEINAALADPKIKARLADLGGTPLVGSPADFGKLIAAETEKWAKVIRAANVKAE